MTFRLRGATSRVVVPLASALVAHRDRYFDLLGEYREGDPRPMIASFAISLRIAAAESLKHAAKVLSVNVASIVHEGEWRSNR